MTLRVTHHLPARSGTTPCSRCSDVVTVIAGEWIAAELDEPRVVCDNCARKDDKPGFEIILAFRRMARPQRCRCARPWAMAGDGCGKCGRAR